MTAFGIAKAVFVGIVELALVLLDAVLLLGFTFFNNVMTSPVAHAGLVVMLIGDVLSFALSWWKPRLGGMILVAVSALSLTLVIVGGTRAGMASLWLTGAVFWGAKGLLALTMLRDSSPQSYPDKHKQLISRAS